MLTAVAKAREYSLPKTKIYKHTHTHTHTHMIIFLRCCPAQQWHTGKFTPPRSSST